jgi:hypothetical protein
MAFPKANYVKNKSPLGKYLSDNSIYGFDANSLTHGLNMDEVVTTGMSFKIANGVQTLVDETNGIVDIVNGFRVTTNLPEQYSRKIWIFGSFVAFGTFADNEHTITSELQRNINSFSPEGDGWAVVNASNYAGNDVDKVFPLLKSLPINENDICIFLIEFPQLLKDCYPEIIDLGPYFDRPHEYGEVFVDINHMTGKGYCIQGKIIFDIIKNRGWFDESAEENFSATNIRTYNYFHSNQRGTVCQKRKTENCSPIVRRL